MIEQIIQNVAADMVDSKSLARDVCNSEYDFEFLAHRINTAISMACTEHTLETMKRLDKHGFINQEMKDVYGYDAVMIEHLIHKNIGE